MKKINKMTDVYFDQKTYFDAWLYALMIDNNLIHEMNPKIIAGTEQIRFMIDLKDKQVYLPCSDYCFNLFLNPSEHKTLQKEYNKAWRTIVNLIKDIEPSTLKRGRLLMFCKRRFVTHIKTHTIIPSRLIKRLTSLVFALMKIDNCWEEKKSAANLKSQEILQSKQMQTLLNAVPKNLIKNDISSIRNELNFIEIARTMYLSAISSQILNSLPSPDKLNKDFETAIELAKPMRELLEINTGKKKNILFLCDADGGIIFDVKLLSCLIHMGHKIILVLKEGFYFYAPTIDDLECDPVFKKAIAKATVIHNPAISKNLLLDAIRSSQMIIISDGTRERLNLYRTSITFARAWKECDLIIAKGWRNEESLMQTSHQFTRNIICYGLDSSSNYKIQIKERSPNAHKQSEYYILAKANEIIENMRQARLLGHSIIFYSCIVGSIPGQTDIAIKLAQVFIENLKFKLPNTYIINPTEYFEKGFDGDDLMFMWEKVQRSGYIDIWHFQTVNDIEESFSLLDLKIPTIWLGKDSTFSTGCTKEMQIALDVQRQFKEMQIIGPSPERFFRRSEYGVGKYYDAQIYG